jgi:glycosyltransferase involved in cell wall biosynthesis
LELALDLPDTEPEERAALERLGWTVRRSHEVAGTPESYAAYVRRSKGEVSCAKPSSVRFAHAWISDRTLCYLASGKPAVVQHTGDSRYLPEGEGLFRFRETAEAAAAMDAITEDYDHHCRAARAVAEEHFDAERVVGRVLERALA